MTDVDFIVSLLRDSATVVSRAIRASVTFSGHSWTSLAFIVLCGAATIALGSRRGSQSMRSTLDVLSAGLPGVFVAFCLVVAFNLTAIPYRAYLGRQETIRSLRESNTALQTILHTRRHSLSSTEPAFENSWGVTMAFRQWRQSLGDESGLLLVTADKEAGDFAGRFTPFAVTGSNLGNGNLQNIGIKPEHTEDVEKAASIDGTLVIHARPEVKGVLQLMDTLGPKVMRIERSYKMPATPIPLPPNVLWLHFGRGVRWSSEYWEEQKAK